MSTEAEKVSRSTEKKERKTFESTGALLKVPVVTGIAVMVLGSLFIVLSSPASGSFALSAVVSTMVGVVVGGFVATVALTLTSLVAPWFGETPKDGFLEEAE